jgi:hypothetical protein
MDLYHGWSKCIRIGNKSAVYCFELLSLYSYGKTENCQENRQLETPIAKNEISEMLSNIGLLRCSYTYHPCLSLSLSLYLPPFPILHHGCGKQHSFIEKHSSLIYPEFPVAWWEVKGVGIINGNATKQIYFIINSFRFYENVSVSHIPVQSSAYSLILRYSHCYTRQNERSFFFRHNIKVQK